MSEKNNNLINLMNKNGFVIIKNLEKICFNHCSINNFKSSPKQDALSLKGIDNFILTRKFLDPIKKILNDNVVYFGDSALHCKPNERLFHKDARADKKDPLFSEYQIYRVGVFLQDHYAYSGGIKFRRGSHKKLSFRLSSLKKILTRKASLSSILNFGRIVNARTKIGDMVIWNLRTDHSGGAVLNKFFPNIGFLPIIDEYTPNFLKKPENSNRMAIFSSFGAPSDELEKYLKYKINDKRYIEHWNNSSFNSHEIINKAKDLNLKILSNGLTNK